MTWRVPPGTEHRTKYREAAVAYSVLFIVIMASELLLLSSENFRAPIWSALVPLPAVALVVWLLWVGLRFLPYLLAASNLVRAFVHLGDFFLPDRISLPRALTGGMSAGIGGLGHRPLFLVNGLLFLVIVFFLLRAALNSAPAPCHHRKQPRSL